MGYISKKVAAYGQFVLVFLQIKKIVLLPLRALLFWAGEFAHALEG